MKPRKQSRRANGDGVSIYWSMNRYVAQVTVGTFDGKPKRKKLYGPLGDKSRAAKLGVEERAKIYAARRGKGDGSAQLKTVVDQWIESAKIRAKTKSFYEWISRKHLGEIGSIPLIDLEKKHIRELLGRLSDKPRTQRAVYGLIHCVLEDAVKEKEMIGLNVAALLKRPQVLRTEQRALTPLEIRYLLKAASGDRLEALVVLALTCSMGPGELFALRPRDVCLPERYLTVNHDLVEAAAYGYSPTLEPPKNPKRRRQIKLPQIAFDALRERMKRRLDEGGGEYVFTSPDGAPIRLSNLTRRWWKPLLKKAAALAEEDGLFDFPVDARMYDLRHTGASLMGHLGVPIHVASDRMGQSNAHETLKTYTHCFPGSDQIVADKLDTFFDDLLAG